VRQAGKGTGHRARTSNPRLARAPSSQSKEALSAKSLEPKHVRATGIITTRGEDEGKARSRARRRAYRGRASLSSSS
jgi:hypothetical protein